MNAMVLTLDTSHSEMSPVNLFDAGTASALNNQLISVTADTFHDPIAPCGPLEQSVDTFRHSLMAAWSSAFGANAMVEECYYREGLRVCGYSEGHNNDRSELS